MNKITSVIKCSECGKEIYTFPDICNRCFKEKVLKWGISKRNMMVFCHQGETQESNWHMRSSNNYLKSIESIDTVSVRDSESERIQDNPTMSDWKDVPHVKSTLILMKSSVHVAERCSGVMQEQRLEPQRTNLAMIREPELGKLRKCFNSMYGAISHD